MIVDIIVLSIIFLLGFIHFLYPLALVLAGLLKSVIKNELPEKQLSEKELPYVSLIIAAYNEENVIEGKLINSLELKYPKDKLEIIVSSDGSTDKTDDIVKKYSSDGVKLNRVEGRKGKTECQNSSIGLAKGEIIVFSDANSFYKEDAIKELVKPIKLQDTDCTIGKLVYTSSGRCKQSKATEEGFFIKFMQVMKRAESKISMPVGANGGIYAVKKNFLTQIPNDSLEDLLRPLQVIQKGGETQYVEKAVATEALEEERRFIKEKKERIASQAIYSIKYFKNIFNPLQFGFFSFQVFYKVVLRRLVYPLLLLLFIGAFLGYFVFEREVYLLFWLFVIALFSIYWVNKYVFNLSKYVPFAKYIDYYVSANYGAFIGLLKGMSGKTFVAWNTSRE